jgi:hypothetical protein
MVARPRVVLFLHVAKCGGTTVRNIFKSQGWHMTFWSLTNKPTGTWHANRLLKDIHKSLSRNHSRIFAEWHVELNFSAVPEIEAHVHNMRRDVRFTSFTILRPPVSLVSSANAYFVPLRPANLSILLTPEILSESLLSLERLSKTCNKNLTRTA